MSPNRPLEAARRFADARNPYAFFIRRRVLEQGGPQFAIMVAGETEGLENRLHRLTVALERNPPLEEVIPRCVEMLEGLYAYHLVWRIGTTLTRSAIDALSAVHQAAPEDARARLDAALEASTVLPFPAGDPAGLTGRMLLWIDGLLPPKRGAATTGKAAAAHLKGYVPPSPAALAQRLQLGAAHKTAASSAVRLAAHLPTGPLPRPVLASLLHAVAALEDEGLAAWCGTRREEALEALAVPTTDWGDPVARDSFLLVVAAWRLGWLEPAGQK